MRVPTEHSRAITLTQNFFNYAEFYELTEQISMHLAVSKISQIIIKFAVDE